MMAVLSARRRLTIVVVATILTIGMFSTLQQTRVSEAIRATIDMGGGARYRTQDKDIYRTGSGYSNGSRPVLANGKERFAYVTFLSGTVDQPADLEQDNYFIATRILVWQLLHNPPTRTDGIDVVVMVTPSVSSSRRNRLRKDGAIIYPVDPLPLENDTWIHPSQPRWADTLTKLRAWQMTQYSRILLLDPDTLLRSPLDPIFHDAGAHPRKPKKLNNVLHLEGEAPLPPTYLLGSLSEVGDSAHDFPPKEGTGIAKVGHFTSAFFLLAPSRPSFEYYRSLLGIPNAFDATQHPDENLLNYAHRWDGPMPWSEVRYEWNIRCPTENDLDRGVVSVHERWWAEPYRGENERVKAFLVEQRWVMKGWYEAWDLRHA